MKKNPLFAAFVLIGLASVGAFSYSPNFVLGIVESLKTGFSGQVFWTSPSGDIAVSTGAMQKRYAKKTDSTAVERPEELLWHVVFDFTERIKTQAAEANEQGNEGRLFSAYFTRQGPLSEEEDLALKRIAAKDRDEITPIDTRARKTADELKAHGPDSKAIALLKELQKEKDEVTLRHRDEFRQAIGEDSYAEFKRFLDTDFSRGLTPKKVVTPSRPDGFDFYGISWIIWDDTVEPPLITGTSALYFYYFFYEGFFYDPSVDSFLVNETTGAYHYGRNDGYREYVPAWYNHPTFYSTRGHYYCTETDHYAVLYDGFVLVDEIYLDFTYACHLVGPAPVTPTPTPTPTPPPAPSPTPTIDPCRMYSPTGDVCDPPPLEIPPDVTISEVPLIEKNGKASVYVTVGSIVGPSNHSVIFKLRPEAGASGAAVFENNNSDEIEFENGAHSLVIKGITESSSPNKMIIEAKWGEYPTQVLASRNFTIAVISALTFERINQDDLAIDANPHPLAGIGDRVFPDKNSSSTTEPDRSILRVKAEVSPAGIPNANVYFASFDLDDPSANAAPIDTNASVGNDNNGSVNGSKSGEFQQGSCDVATTANNVSKIACPINGADARANYKVTMQPGDNFSVAASLVDTYRDSIMLDPNNGGSLINGAQNTIPISGEGNSNNIQGIRSRMLTVWRKLHLEVDSMQNLGTNNNVTGTITFVSQTVCPNPPGSCVVSTAYIVTTSTPLELQRFNDGAIRIGSTNYEVDRNEEISGNQVVVLKGIPRGSQNISVPASFTLYDDDDYNNDDSVPDGDSSEPLVQFPDTFYHLTTNDGNYPDGTPQNLYASSYVMPEYQWAIGRNYNQSNVTFDLNVEYAPSATAILASTINQRRNSASDESDDFWIAYLIIGYQGPLLSDFDGVSGSGTNESSDEGVVLQNGSACDCLNSSTCPSTTPAPITCTTVPLGGDGGLVFQEVIQDIVGYFANPPSPISPRAITDIRTTGAHEVSHQFGLQGDEKRDTFMIMDYPDYLVGTTTGPVVALHPEHINIIRRRTKSPGN